MILILTPLTGVKLRTECQWMFVLLSVTRVIAVHHEPFTAIKTIESMITIKYGDEPVPLSAH